MPKQRAKSRIIFWKANEKIKEKNIINYVIFKQYNGHLKDGYAQDSDQASANNSTGNRYLSKTHRLDL